MDIHRNSLLPESNASEFPISSLKKLALGNLENMISQEEIRRMNITDLLVGELQSKLSYKECLVIQIIGETTTGKSTLGCAIMIWCNEQLNKKPSMKHICGDQVEFLRKLSDSELSYVMLLVDEWNPLGETGVNATTEQSQLRYYSDVQAQRYIHRVCCSPEKVMDNNATIVLEVFSTNKEAKTTTVLVHYRLSQVDMVTFQLCGYAELNVSKAVEWPEFEAYRKKKFAKMGLVIKEGVRDVREIIYAGLVLETYYSLKGLTRVMEVKKSIVAGCLDNERRKRKELLSLLSKEELIRGVCGLLDIDRQIFKSYMSLKKLKKKYKTEDKEIPVDLLTESEDAIRNLMSVRERQLENYVHLANLGEKYSKL